MILRATKIERWFRTGRSQFLPGFLGETLRDINVAWDLWIREVYHQRCHSSTAQASLNRFEEHIERIRAAPRDLDDYFREEIRRRVTKDRTVSINNRLFEAPTKLIGEQVSLLYHDYKPEQIEIMHKSTLTRPSGSP